MTDERGSDSASSLQVKNKSKIGELYGLTIPGRNR